MRFADTDGTVIDVYQAHTHMTDEAGRHSAHGRCAARQRGRRRGLLRRLRRNMHTDDSGAARAAEEIVASARRAASR